MLQTFWNFATAKKGSNLGPALVALIADQFVEETQWGAVLLLLILTVVGVFQGATLIQSLFVAMVIALLGLGLLWNSPFQFGNAL